MRIFLILLLFLTSSLFAQETQSLKGLILDADKLTPLPYTNIVILKHALGTVSNEVGEFSLDITNLDKQDSISFQYIGYQSLNITIAQFDSISTYSNSIIYLKEDILNLNEVFVFSDPPKAKSIIKKMVENIDDNYIKDDEMNQVFIRQKNISDINNIKIKLQRNDIPQLNKKLLKVLETKMPRHSTSYTDFFGNLFFSKKPKDSIKIAPVRVVALKEKSISELDDFYKVFDNLFSQTEDKEYWKVKTGIISQAITINNDKDTSSTIKDPNNYRIETNYFKQRIQNKWEYSTLKNEDDWEFLYKTSKYNYTLVGGAKINGEDAYVINFTPKASGSYIGRVYISINNYALIRADYKFDKGKKGTNIHLLGVGYTENEFMGSIYFEKKDSIYKLKYLSKKTGSLVSFNRKVSLIKKRKRFLIDKELFELKVKFTIEVDSQESTELLVLKNQNIKPTFFTNFKEQKFVNIILVDQFDDQLWKGYPIIEPTKRIRDYKKME